MELKNRVDEDNCSMNEALLLAFFRIIGLPVDVHLKDGSVYYGIFHTASVEKEYGIVLKKAKLTKKGRCATNVANDSVVETLVILAGDFVQVVAKVYNHSYSLFSCADVTLKNLFDMNRCCMYGVPLPFDGSAGNIAHGNRESAFEILPSCANPQSETRKFNKSTMDKRKSNRKSRNSVQNENGFADGFIPTKPGEEHEYQKLLQNSMGSAKDVEYQKRDGTNIEKGEDASGATIAGRHEGDDRSVLLQDENQKFELHVEDNDKEVQRSISSYESSAHDTLKTGFNLSVSHDTRVDGKLDNPCCERPTAIDIHQDAVCSGVSTCSTVTDVSPESCQNSLAAPTGILPPQSSESNKNSKEFKLNPGAKVFSPSYATTISAASPMVPTVANVSYIPGSSPMIAVVGSQPEVGMGSFAPRSSAPYKFVSCGNITAATAVSGSQFSQHIVGHMGGRTQPLKYAGQYHPVQAAPACLNPNSQAVMFGRMGQLICAPVSHDLIQDAAALSPVPARPLAQYHVQFPKHQANAPGQAFQLYVPQPFIAGGQQPLAVPSHIQFLQTPFPINHPIQVPGSKGPFSTKLP